MGITLKINWAKKDKMSYVGEQHAIKIRGFSANT
jgi:hypothetical protein